VAAEVWLGLGSNLGDRAATLAAALGELPRQAIEVTAVSSLYATAPQELTDQPEFLNCVAHATTNLSPAGTLAACREMEAGFGRQRMRRWGPRTLDIDVLFFNNLSSDDPMLQLPHPRLWRRAFVLAPLLELWPDLAAPSGVPARQLLEALSPAQPVRVVAPAGWWRDNLDDERRRPCRARQ